MDDIQDFNGTPILFGADVAALYPSLEQTDTAALVAKAVEETDIEFAGVDYEIIAIYLLLTVGEQGIRRLDVGNMIPELLGES